MSEVLNSHEGEGQENDVFEVWREALDEVEFAGDKSSGNTGETENLGVAEEIEEVRTMSEIEPVDDAAETMAAGEGISSREYREGINAPKCDLFAKRRCIIAEQYPILQPVSKEETFRRLRDEDYQAQRRQALGKVPKDVRDEYELLGTMISRMEDGIDAGLRPDSELASSEPNYVAAELQTEDGTFVTTKWKAKESAESLSRLHELHEKNSQIIDFSHEAEVDIDGIPEELQGKITSLREAMEMLKTADFEDFEPHGNKRPKAAAIYDQIFGIEGTNNMSHETRREIRRIGAELYKQYNEARNAAELRSINARIEKLQQEKAEIAERQKRYEDAGFVSRVFQRLLHRDRMRMEQTRTGRIDAAMDELTGRAEQLGGKK